MDTSKLKTEINAVVRFELSHPAGLVRELRDAANDPRLQMKPVGLLLAAADEVERLGAEVTRAVLRYTARGYAAGENADAKHWRERAEAAEAKLADALSTASPAPASPRTREQELAAGCRCQIYERCQYCHPEAYSQPGERPDQGLTQELREESAGLRRAYGPTNRTIGRAAFLMERAANALASAKEKK